MVLQSLLLCPIISTLLDLNLPWTSGIESEVSTVSPRAHFLDNARPWTSDGDEQPTSQPPTFLAFSHSASLYEIYLQIPSCEYLPPTALVRQYVVQP
ncbi:hypothetical protein A0H81_04358 [Grifola frondosa]|uniref:Uncharacterized protein n=1 Tax=Grifola frondosa TaxID=5627 RepID=A0A1C7MEV7_GRIFR|nr:hypothetical protein A0H81_04358 [Grifola frondosa]